MRLGGHCKTTFPCGAFLSGPYAVPVLGSFGTATAYFNARTTDKALSRKITFSPSGPEGCRTKKIASPGVPEGCDLSESMPTSGRWNYISTISLPVSSFQLATRYQRHMASAMMAKVPP